MLLILALCLTSTLVYSHETALSTEERVRLREIVRGLVQSKSGISNNLPEELSFIPDFWSHGRSERLAPEDRDGLCLACEVAVDTIIELWISGMTTEEIEGDLANVCILIGLTGALDNEVCRGAIYSYAPILEFIVKNTNPTITGPQICGAVLGTPETPCGDSGPACPRNSLNKDSSHHRHTFGPNIYCW